MKTSKLESVGGQVAMAAAGLLLSACSGGVTVRVPSVPVIHEAEINDQAWSANVIGPLRPGDQLRIRGAIGALGPDLFDGFAFFSAQALDLEFILTPDDPFADLDLCVFDPPSNAFTLCFASPAQPEVGVFTLPAGVDFHLVVESFAGDSAYWLDLTARAPSSYSTAGASAQDMQRPSAHRERYKSGAMRTEEDPWGPQLQLQPLWLLEIDEQGELRQRPLLGLPLGSP